MIDIGKQNSIESDSFLRKVYLQKFVTKKLVNYGNTNDVTRML